jgi:hypothetical protein
MSNRRLNIFCLACGMEASAARLTTPVSFAQVPAEKRQDMVLEAAGNGTGVCALINLKSIGDTVTVENLVQFRSTGPQSVAVAYIDRNALIAPQIRDILVNEREGSIRGPFGDHILLYHSILDRQIEIERWVLRIWRPCRGGRKLSARAERESR